MDELTYNGKKFSEFDTFFDGSKAFGTPEKDYELVEVMGRNGSLSIYNDRFKDIQLPFPCFIRSNFVTRFRALTEYLNSQQGYQKLETSKEPNHYRKALFQGIVEPQTTPFNHGGFFTINFLAKPQRFLKSGDTPVSADAESESYTGSVAEVDNPSGLDKVTALAVDINPVQDLSNGDPSPTNICPITGWDSCTVTRTGKNLLGGTALRDAVLAAVPSAVTGSDEGGDYVRFASTATTVQPIARGFFKEGTRYTFIITARKGNDSSGANLRINYSDGTYTTINGLNGTTDTTIIVVSAIGKDVVSITKQNSSNTTYLYYNECGIFEGVLTADDFEEYRGTTYPVSFSSAGTVYGGTLNVTTGELTVNRVNQDITTGSWAYYTAGENPVFRKNLSTRSRPITMEPICSCYSFFGETTLDEMGRTMPDGYFGFQSTNDYIAVRDTRFTDVNDFKAALAGETLCYELKTPQTYQLTPQQVELLIGMNYISADSGDVAVTVSSPAKLENPTLFEPKPLIRCYGTGTVNINDQYITISSHPYPYLDIDCELMDAKYGLNNANGYVSFSTTDYITLKVGDNYITHNLTKVEITPRWYEV